MLGCELCEGRSVPACVLHPLHDPATAFSVEGTWEYCSSCGVQGSWFARHLIAGRVSEFCKLDYKLGFLIHLGW